MWKLKAEEIAGALDAYAEKYPRADIRVKVGDDIYYVSSQVAFDLISGRHVVFIADVDGKAE